MAEQDEMMPTQVAERQEQVADGDCVETHDQALALMRRPDNQDQTTDMMPVAAVNQLQQSVHQISGSGHVPIFNPKDCTINIYQSKDGAHASHHSGHPSVDISENPPSTSQQPPTSHVASGAQGCSTPKKMKLDSPAQDAADCCEDALKSYYRGKGGFVKVLPWVGDDRKHITEIYTKLQLILGKDSVKLASYDDILQCKTKEGDPILIAVLTGLAGRGKTTLFDKMAYDWAVGSSQVLRKYKLVFLLKMYALEQSSDLVDAVFDKILAKDVSIERGALDMFIKNSPGSVLVLLDGFDELMTTSLCESSFGSILEILSGKVLRGCTVLVTTRPSHFDRLVSEELVQDPFTHVEVIGFSRKDVTEYVNKFYTAEPDKAKGLLKKIRSSGVLSALAASPMLLLLMCVLWREDCTLPETMTCLYRNGVLYIFKRKSLDSAKDMIEIGKVALHGLLSQDQSLSFKESDFKSIVLERALKAGILTKQTDRKGLQTHNCIQFFHKTFQEFYAAAYLQSLLKADPEKFHKILNEIMSKGARTFEYLLRFCCGDNEACTYEIMKEFQLTYPKKLSFKSKMGQLALHCFFEGQSKRLPPEEFIHSFITDEFRIHRLDRDCLNSVIYFVKCVAEQTKDSGNAYLAKVHTLHVRFCQWTWFIEELAVILCAMTNLRDVSFMNNADTAKLLRHLPNLVPKLRIFGTDLGGTAASWCMHLKQLKSLTKLVLSECSLNGQDIKQIAESLGDLPNLVELSLELNNDLGGTAALWCTHLKQLKSLTKLDLGHCSLNGQDMKQIAESLRDLTNLGELSLTGNNLGGTAALWCMHLKQLKSLTKLELSRCSLNGQDIKQIAESLGDLPNLVELSLCSSKLGGTAAFWCMHLKQLKSLTKLNLGECSLNGQDIKHVAESLRDLPNLGELNLSYNNLGGTAALWCMEVKQLLHLQWLYLIDCHLTEEDKNHIDESLSDLKKNGLVIRTYR
ncbi:NLR family CARD domain-containing protein 4-like isoform X2 [Patiria miniata]|nr:NLR family CARD domain-containing protein 4-like isoform X2 [Patiria miniata]